MYGSSINVIESVRKSSNSIPIYRDCEQSPDGVIKTAPICYILGSSIAHFPSAGAHGSVCK